MEDNARESLPDPAIVWQHLDKMRTAVKHFAFSYLFLCIEGAPEHSVKSANKVLIKEFLSGNLGVHLSEFNILIAQWLIGVPDVEDDQVMHLAIFDGVRTLSVLYKNLVLDYFVLGNIRQQNYFD